MKQEDQEFRHAIHGLHQATHESVSNAWFLFFSDCRRIAAELRAKRAEAASMTVGNNENDVTQPNCT